MEPFVMDVAPTGETLTAAEMVTACHSHLVEFFLQFASGHVKAEEYNPKTGNLLSKRQPPYGTKVGSNSHYFRSVSPSWLAITAASIYPFLVADKKEWSDLRVKSFAYKITGFWPVRLLRRYNHFNNVYREHLQRVWRNYESTGGKYYEDDDDDDGPAESESDIIDEGNSCDDVF